MFVLCVDGVPNRTFWVLKAKSTNQRWIFRLKTWGSVRIVAVWTAETVNDAFRFGVLPDLTERSVICQRLLGSAVHSRTGSMFVRELKILL